MTPLHYAAGIAHSLYPNFGFRVYHYDLTVASGSLGIATSLLDVRISVFYYHLFCVCDDAFVNRRLRKLILKTSAGLLL